MTCLWSVIFGLVFVLFSMIDVYSEDTVIEGHYCYTYGDKETLNDAKQRSKTLAIRDALENYKVYVRSSTNLKNFEITTNVVDTVSTGYLSNIDFYDYEGEGKEICHAVSGTIKTKDIDTIVDKIKSKPQNSRSRLVYFASGGSAGDYYYFKDRISIKDEQILIWIYRTNAGGYKNKIINGFVEMKNYLEAKKYEYYLYTIALYGIICKYKLFRVVESIDYNKKGEIIRDNNYGDKVSNPWENVIPGSTIEPLFVEVCK